MAGSEPSRKPGAGSRREGGDKGGGSRPRMGGTQGGEGRAGLPLMWDGFPSLPL